MKGTPREPRYRVEGTHTCIDISLHTAQQLFDWRDPAPFRERDLDEDAADYIYAAATDIPRERPLKLVLVLEQPLGPSLSASVIETAVRRVSSSWAGWHYGNPSRFSSTSGGRLSSSARRSRGSWPLRLKSGQPQQCMPLARQRRTSIAPHESACPRARPCPVASGRETSASV